MMCRSAQTWCRLSKKLVDVTAWRLVRLAMLSSVYALYESSDLRRIGPGPAARGGLAEIRASCDCCRPIQIQERRARKNRRRIRGLKKALYRGGVSRTLDSP